MLNPFLIFSFLFGLIIGSFLNTVIYRYNTGRTVGGRSKCLSCGHTLTWRELIPVVSYVIQGGKCAKCGSQFSATYPLVEFFTALLFLGVSIKFLPNSFEFVTFPRELVILLVVHWFIMSLLMVIAVYDLRHKIIPDGMVYAFIVVSAMMAWWQNPEALLAGGYFFAFFGFIWLASRGKWLGFGDAKFVTGIGFMLGLTSGVSALMIACWSGALCGLSGMGLSRLRQGSSSLTIKSELPFAPFLILGLLVVFFFQINVFELFKI